MDFKFALGLLVGSAVACAPSSGALPEDQPTEASTAERSAVPTKPVPQALVAPKTTICSRTEGTTRKDQACWRWRCDGDAVKAASWDGDSAACTAGDLDADAADRALRRINVHRFLADVAPFTAEPAWTSAAQQCALIAHANAKLSHEPPHDWKCWAKSGADISEGSLVANRSVAASIAAYFEDLGNETTMVHRRWLLDETLASVGFGSTDHYSCVVVDGETVGKPSVKPSDGRGWSAWPPAGPVPLDVFAEEALDTAGWTVQSTKSDLDDANVTVTRDGVEVAVTTTHLTALLGSRSAIRFVPQGWVTEAGHAYGVSITGSAAIELTVEPTDCH